MDAITVLAHDHDELLELLLRMARHGSESPQQREVGRQLVHRMLLVEASHEDLEATFLWPVVENDVPDGPEIAARTRAAEKLCRESLARLGRMPPQDPEYAPLRDDTARRVREHLAYEQDVVWPALRNTLSPKRLAELGAKMAAAQDATPGYERKS